jgi:hypothetical protein
MSSRSELQFGAYAASALVKLSILVKYLQPPLDHLIHRLDLCVQVHQLLLTLSNGGMFDPLFQASNLQFRDHITLILSASMMDGA